jgi:peptidoglycan/LPS O-acetylase OafA/YrhL
LNYLLNYLLREDGLEQDKHFAALDGLRGFAAVSVVIFHIGHWLNMPTLAANAGLAVDLFFCLSGYVLALAYGKRLGNTLSPFAFIRLRLIRLMPLIVLGTIVSAAYAFIRAYVKHEELTAAALWTAFVFGLLNIPFFGAPKSLGGPQIFPLNGPQYTLFLELFVNALWSLSRRLNEPKVAILTAAACFLFLPFGLGGDTAGTFWSGFPRVGASFFAGVAVFHIERRFALRFLRASIFWLLAAAMAALFYFPRPLANPFLLLWVGLLSPMLVLAGARVKLAGPLRRFALFGGEISFAVYALHYPLFCWVSGVYQAAGGPPNLAIEGPVILASVIVGSFAALRIYDEPLRREVASFWGRARSPSSERVMRGRQAS